jgi:RNA polymerase sigma factor (sigma-70 family)
MSNTFPVIQDQHSTAQAESSSASSHTALHDDLERLLAQARPRLLRLAQRAGITSEDAEDIAQETLIAAWRELAYLRDPQRFDAWLDGICRNLVRSHARSASRSRLRSAPLPGASSEDNQGGEESATPDLPDPSAFDPAEELCRQDLETLLDRALGYLPERARLPLILHYLEDVPQREAALRLGLTVSALEARLHRARQQLRQVLSSDLHAEAEALGLTLDPALAEGWRESRQWCMFCGQRRLHGTFECLPNGKYDLRMRCPECSRAYGTFINGSGMVSLAGLHSFRPALKRLYQEAAHYFAAALANGGWATCLDCAREPVQIRVAASDQAAIPGFHPPLFMLVAECPRCAPGFSVVMAAFMVHPAVEQFIEQHPRWVIEPDRLTEYAGQPAICHRLAAFTNPARLNLFISPETLQVLGVIAE